MPLKRVTIKSFKSIVNQTIDLGQLNVFIGTNGSGKSNFLEAIGVLSSAIDGEVSYNKLADRGVRLSAYEVFKSSFKNLPRKKSFSLDANFDDFDYHANIIPSEKYDFCFSAEKLQKSGHKLAGRSNRGVSINTLEGFKTTLPRQQSVVSTLEALGSFSDKELDSLNSLRDYAIYSLSTPILRGVAPDQSRKEPLGLYAGSLASALKEVIDDIHASKSSEEHQLRRFFRLLEWFDSIGTSNNISPELQSSHIHTGKRVVKYVDRYMGTKFKDLYAYDVSEGALYILFILLLVLHQKSPNIFALDNVDNALNPGLVRSLMSNIAAMLLDYPDKQILMTTHNPTTLDAVDLFNNQHRLFVVDRNEKGYTEIIRIQPPPGFTRETWVKKYEGMKLSEIWLSGIIGGLPTTGF